MKQRLFCPDCGVDFYLLVDQPDETVTVGCFCTEEPVDEFFEQLDVEMGSIETATNDEPTDHKRN